MVFSQQTPTGEITAATTNLERDLEHARSFVGQVRERFADRPYIFNRFLDIFKDFRSGTIDRFGVHDLVSQLFVNNSDLIQGLNTFLPSGNRIDRRVFWEPFRETAPTETTLKPFSVYNFFQLPVELRIQIYNEALIKLVKLRPPPDGPPLELVVYAKNFADPNLRLVSKQFRDEYMCEAEKKTILVVEDAPDYQWTFVRLPRNVQYVRKLEVYFRMLCHPYTHIFTNNPCNIIQELQMHYHWILKLTKLDLPALQSFSINIYCDPHHNCVECPDVLKEYERILTTLDRLASLRVYGTEMCREWEGDTGYAFDQPRKLGM